MNSCLKGINIYRRAHRRYVAESQLRSRRERIDERNRLLVLRYYYWTEIRRMRFDDVVRILSDKEFFIDERTIQQVIMQNANVYKSLLTGELTVNALRREFPSWNWTAAS